MVRNGDEAGNDDRPTKRLRSRFSLVNKLPTAAASKSRDRGTTSTNTATTDKWDALAKERVAEEGKSEQQQQNRPSADEERNKDGGSVIKSVFVTLSDPDVLDCPICFEPLCSPVYQCENGHMACASCCITIKNICATCDRPIGYIRCRPIENVLESITVTCRNMPYGCKETFSYSKKLAHEKACTFTCCSCPLSDCGYVGIAKSVHAHFAQTHSKYSTKFDFRETISISLHETRKYVYLQERKVNTLFILNHSVETVGRFVNVVCIAPNSENGAFSYALKTTDGQNSIKLKSSVGNMPKWAADPPADVYLVVPSHFISSSGHLKVDLIIFSDFIS